MTLNLNKGLLKVVLLDFIQSKPDTSIFWLIKEQFHVLENMPSHWKLDEKIDTMSV